jgi:hypothetical protein
VQEFVAFYGIESPGLTAALALAERCLAQLADPTGNTPEAI